MTIFHWWWCFSDSHLGQSSSRELLFRCHEQVSAFSLIHRCGKEALVWRLLPEADREARQEWALRGECSSAAESQAWQGEATGQMVLTADSSSLILRLLGLFLKIPPLYTCISRAFWMKSPNCENHDYGQLCKLAYLADILAHADNARSSWEGGLSRHQYSTCGTGEAPVAGGGVFSWFRWPGGKLTWRSR